LAEFQVRTLVRRVDKLEVEERELRAKCGRFEYLDEDERKAQLRTVRRWLAEDLTKLRVLLGAPRDLQRG